MGFKAMILVMFVCSPRNPDGVSGRLADDHLPLHKLGSHPTRSHVELDGKTKRTRLRDVADANTAMLRFTVGQAKARYPREEQNRCEHRIYEEEGPRQEPIKLYL